MKFNIVPGTNDPEEEKTLDVQLVGHDGGVLLRAREEGGSGEEWIYIAKLSQAGLSLFTAITGLDVECDAVGGRIRVLHEAEPYPRGVEK